MRYVFFGTPRIARIVLEHLLKQLPPVAVVTNPDRPAGRKQVMTSPPVKLLLQETHSAIELLQPENPRDIKARLKELQPDLFLVVAYGRILAESLLAIPRLGAVGIHPSLLPKYRGSSPFQTALLKGEERTGVTLYLMDKEVDHGPVLASKDVAVGDMDYLELEAALGMCGAQLAIETLPEFVSGAIKPREQDHAQATFTQKFESEDACIPWEQLEQAVIHGDPNAARTISLMIRAFNPEPGAWTLKNGQRIKLLNARLENDRLILERVQRAGKLPETIADRGSLP